MTARRRALAIITGLAVLVAGWVAFVAEWSGPAGAGPAGRFGVAGARAAALGAFRGELLVWAPGGFSEREVARVRDSTRVAAISAVRTGVLAAASGRRSYQVVPVEAMAVDPNAYTTAAGRPGRKLATMLPKGPVLSKTGARLRKAKVGSRLRLAGHRSLRVSGVVEDALLGGYELALDRNLARRYGVLRRAGYLLVRPRGPVEGLKAEIRRLLKGRPVRFLTPGDRPFVRGGEAVLPLATVKARFGEFALPSLEHGRPDPAWTRANVVTRKVPLLGWVNCHRLVVGHLAKAMGELRRQGLGGLVDVADFRRRGGCWSPRLLRDPRGRLSRHAWGIAVALKVTGDDRLVRIMADHGFAWGGGFTRPNPTHFEWVGRGPR
jgi:hypothetical protein